ncbi:MAG: UDP-glucose/GDP-mannose dehydrogenase family protein [Candidatus Niyogibacteria bacterium]|nr:UDP-glucose/GDP-mannose dehydrogenase family protein [Candidatus Niyogibacteria bacterium]
MSGPKIGIVGIGFVGDTLRRWFVKTGWRSGRNLFCYDADPRKGYAAKEAIYKADIVFICVPTPVGKRGRCDTSIVEAVVRDFARSSLCLVVRSTVPPGTAKRLAVKYGVRIVSYPEFLTEKNARRDFQRPSRQVFGFADDDITFRYALEAMLPQSTVIDVSTTEAEMIKYLSNVFGAFKVVFANVAKIYCDAFGADYEKVRAGIAADQRIGDSWLDVEYASYRGFGGYCFPKDLLALIVEGDILARQLKKKNERLAGLLREAVHYLRAGYHFNERLLASQGLTVPEVSGHITEEKDIEQKRKARS